MAAQPDGSVSALGERQERGRGAALHRLEAALVAGTAYFATAVFGLEWATVQGAVSPVWPAAGVALAGLVLGGLALAPVLLVAAALAYVAAGTTLPPATVVALATGNAVAAALATVALRRARFDPALIEVRDVVLLAAVGAAGAAAVAASVAVGALAAAGAVRPGELAETWLRWWSGDALGVVLVAPLVFAWRGWRPDGARPARVAHFALAVAVTAALAFAVFWSPPPVHVLAWAIMAPLVWVAFQFGAQGATLAAFVVAGVAIAGTAAGLGPFVQFADSRYLWQYLAQFLAIGSLVALCLAVAASGRFAERMLRASERQLRELADAIPQIVTVGDADGRLVWANRGAGGYFGVPDPSAEPWLERVHPDDRGRLDAAWRDALAAGEALSLEVRLRGADGRFRWFLARTSPVRDAEGQVVRWYGTNTDIEAQKAAEGRLRALADASESFTRSLDAEVTLKQVLDAVVPAHADWAIVHVLTGSRREDRGFHVVRHADGLRTGVLERTARALGPKGPAARTVLDVVAGGEALRVGDLAGAEAATLDVAARRLFVESLRARSALFLPLTARARTFGVLILGLSGLADPARRYGADDVEFAAELARRCAVALDQAALYRTAQSALAELRAADRRKDEFLATLAHELRNPLAPLRNALAVLRAARGDPRVATAAEATMERQLRHMVRLIDDLLDVSRIATGKLRLRRERVELGAVLAQALETARPAVEGGRHRLVVTPAARPVWIDADPVRLAQVVVNLLNNATKYSEPGTTIELRVEEPAPRRARIVVADTGIGIPAEAQGRIFELFAQVESGDVRTQGGLGIGLSLARRIVELHGGTIAVQSDGPGHGSTFTIELPAASRAGDEAADRAARADGGSRRILVADDNRDAADSLAMLLRLSGHDVAVAYDGAEAVELAARTDPQVLLLDIGMPRLDGYQVADQVRAAAGGERRVLVAVTGWGQDADRQRSREAGFDHHFTKPVDPADVARLLGGPAAARAPF